MQAYMHTENTHNERCFKGCQFLKCVCRAASAAVARCVFSLCWNVPAAWENNDASVAPTERRLHTPLFKHIETFLPFCFRST